MMKKYLLGITIPTFLLLLTAFPAEHSFAQNSMGFSYDSCGNRIRQEILFPKAADFAGDSSRLRQQLEFKDDIAEMSITISPNPTCGELDILLNNLDPEQTASMQIHNLSGEVVIRQVMLTTENHIDVRNYPPGIYILSITIDGKPKSWKLIKQ